MTPVPSLNFAMITTSLLPGLAWTYQRLVDLFTAVLEADSDTYKRELESELVS